MRKTNLCRHYKGVGDPKRFAKAFGVSPPETLGVKEDLWSGYLGSFNRRPEHWAAGDEAVPAREVSAGRFGLIPHWATVLKIGATLIVREARL